MLVRLLNSYHGTLKVMLIFYSMKEIIDGTKQPNPPRICVDFAGMLHNNAEKAGYQMCLCLN